MTGREERGEAEPAPEDVDHPELAESRRDDGDAAADLAREVYWAGDGVSRLPADVGLVGERLDAYAHQMRVEQRQLVPADKILLGIFIGVEARIKLFIWRLTRFSTMRYDRLLADLADMNAQLARRLLETEEELARLREDLERRGGSGIVRIAVLHPQTAFTRGGAELHAEALVRALKNGGHEAELVTIAGKWYPATELAHQMAVWRSFDISESNGLKVDAVIALKFPAYLAQHERKIVWLIHQHRSAYELWDHPEFSDLSRQDDGPAIRQLVWNSDRVALGEAKGLFTNSRNVADRLWNSLRLRGEVVYHRSPATDALLEREPFDLGDYIFYPSRLESLKRQALAIDAMRHVRTPVKLVLVGRGPHERLLGAQIRLHGLQDRVRMEIGVPDERLYELYLGALGVFFGAYDEDYGYVTIEGYAAERPVVTLTDSGGPLEFVEDRVTGLVAEPTARAVAHAFDTLWSEREAAAAWGRAGKNLLLDRVPAWPDVVERLLG